MARTTRCVQVLISLLINLFSNLLNRTSYDEHNSMSILCNSNKMPCIDGAKRSLAPDMQMRWAYDVGGSPSTCCVMHMQNESRRRLHFHLHHRHRRHRCTGSRCQIVSDSNCVYTLVYRCLHGLAPHYLSDLCTPATVHAHPVANRGGQRGRFAPGGTLRGRQKREKRKRKKEKKEKKKKKRKKRKKKKKKIWEKHVITVKLNWNILAAAPLCTHNLTFWRPYPLWR